MKSSKEGGDPSHERIAVYVPKPDVQKLRIKLIEKTGSGNISNWVREQIRKFLITP